MKSTVNIMQSNCTTLLSKNEYPTLLHGFSLASCHLDIPNCIHTHTALVIIWLWYDDSMDCANGNGEGVRKIEGLHERTEYVPQLWNWEMDTRNASDAGENLQLYWVVQFFHPRSSCTMTHLMLFSERPPICFVHDDLGGRTEQLGIIAGFLPRSLALRVILVRQKHLPIYASCMTISGGRTEQHIVIGFGELAAVD